MVEVERNEFASRGVGAAGLTTGIIGTALGAMGTGILPGLFGNGNHCCNSDSMPINRYEAAKNDEIARLRSEISLRDANTYVDQKLLEVYRYFDTKLEGVNAAICQQNVYNATNTAALNCINNQVAQLMGLTKLVVPNSSICPGWGNVTVAVAPTATT